MKNDVVIYYQKFPVILGLLSSISFFGISYFIELFIAQIIFMTISVIILIDCFRKLLHSQSYLKIDKDGITNNTDLKSLGLIKWNEISKIEFEQNRFRHQVIKIKLYKTEQYLKNNKLKFRKFFANRYFNMTGNLITIDCTTLNYEYYELKSLIKLYLEQKT